LEAKKAGKTGVRDAPPADESCQRGIFVGVLPGGFGGGT
jgi:hypothetical protein